MKKLLNSLDEFLESRLLGRARLIVLLAILLVVPSYFYPLWTMAFYSNQYPDGLKMALYINHLQGQKSEFRDDLREINSLNHYIGMRPILESDFAEFTWLPLVLGALILLSLRAIFMGKTGNLIDVFVMTGYFGLFGIWSFYYRLYTYGHNLDPQAPIKVDPFTPPLFGTHQVANFTVYSYPAIGSLFLILFGLILFIALIVQFLKWRKTRAESAN